MEIKTDPAVDSVFARYPKHVLPIMQRLRSLVHEVAVDLEHVDKVDETLKWGEPSFLTNHGSTLRMDWKQKTPDQVALYVSCSSQLVPTFRDVFGDQLSYEGNRAIVLSLDQELPEQLIRRCIGTALQYHKLKNKPLLGLV